MRENHNDAELLHADRDARVQAYDEGIAKYHEQHPEDAAHLTQSAIAACRLCDREGYRGQRVCDHQDHTAAAKRGIAACRQALAKGDPQ
jgi:ferredoxin-NADP reductase